MPDVVGVWNGAQTLWRDGETARRTCRAAGEERPVELRGLNERDPKGR